MNILFSKILDMSLTASFAILTVLMARYLLRKGPKVISYALWAVVLFRLLCPVSITAPLSLLEMSKPQVTMTAERTSTVSYLPEIMVTPSVSDAIEPAVQAETPILSSVKAEPRQEKMVDLLNLGTWCWLAGVLIMVLSSLSTYCQLFRRLVGATPLQDGVYLADHIATPFVLGIFRAKIYLPSGTPKRERSYIIAHEEHHIHRCDHIVKLLAYGALCLHWFNPLVWVAFFLAGKDMEMSCDEAVIRKLGPDIRAEYAQTLLRLATNRPIIAGTPLAFGEGNTKGRVKHMIKWRKPKTWVVILSIVVCISVLVSCAVNPSQKEHGEPAENIITREFETEPTEETKITQSVSIGMSLPADIAVTEDQARTGEKLFLQTELMSDQIDASEQVGGIRIYSTPEQSIEDMDGWLRVLGVRQIVDGGYDYMISGGISYDLEASFADAGGRETKHYYYIQGQQVFEVWFSTSKLDSMTRAAILESVYFAPDATIERGLPVTQESAGALAEYAATKEAEIHLAECRKALEEIQARESYTVKINRNNYGEVIINDTSDGWYYKNGEDWLLENHIPDEGFEKGFGTFVYMVKDGVHYSNEYYGWDENEDVVWSEAELDPNILPWIARFQWDAQDVLHISTVPAGKGRCITMQVMAPYYENNEDACDFYQMQFIFDEHAKLIRVENTIDFYSEIMGGQAYSSTETMQFSDNFAKAVLAQEYQRYLDSK